MLPIDTDRDRKRLCAALLAAALLHGLLFALLIFIPAPGGERVARGSASGFGGQAGRAHSVSLRVIPILVAPLDSGGEIPRDTSARAIAERRAMHETVTDTDIAVCDATSAGDVSGVSGVSGKIIADGPGSTDGINGAGGAGDTYGTVEDDAFRKPHRAFIGWLDSAIRARLSYPERARARNAEGTVVIALTVPSDGSRCEAIVAESSGSAILDRAAVELIRSLFPAKVAPESPFSAPVKISFTLSPSS